MILNEFGEIVQKYWLEIPNHFPFVSLDEFTIMPNHMHGILIIDNDNNCRIDAPGHSNCRDAPGHSNRRDAPRRVSTGDDLNIVSMQNKLTRKFGPLQKNSISSIVNHFKGNITKGCRKINPYFSWQSNYYEHVIRDECGLNRIRQYIIDNPKNWGKDSDNKMGLWI